jgi:hypothetical protein
MNPTVLMAVFGRRELVEINLRLLSAQSCQIVVVASLPSDFDYLRALAIPHLQIVPAPNRPLGNKWQVGADQCRILKADPLIILGSDDYLSGDFIRHAVELSKVNDLTCFNRWSVYDTKTRLAYALQYNDKMVHGGFFPLGSGRIFSARFLNRNYWQLFDSSRDRQLDDFAYYALRVSDVIQFNPVGLALLAVKGGWEQFNPLEKLLTAPNISWKKITVGELDLALDLGAPVAELFKSIY